MLQAPQESPYDLNLTLLGFQIRVSWTFWLGALVFGHGLAQMVDRYWQDLSIGMAPLLVLWVLCLFVSILIHELGHALAFRQFGIDSRIVLYHFGGLAIPSSWGPSAGRLTEKQDLWVTFAGPLAQLVSAFLMIAVVKYNGYEVFAFKLMPVFLYNLLEQVPGLTEGNLLDSVGLFALVTFYVLPSVLWALLNLVPVYPLDGGRITRSLVLLSGGNVSQSLWISIVAAGVLAVYAFNNNQVIMAMFFAMFGYSNYQALQQTSNWRF